MINVADPALKDIRLRQALAYCFNQEAYCADIGRGLARRRSPAPSRLRALTTVPLRYPAYNLAKAQALVAVVVGRPRRCQAVHQVHDDDGTDVADVGRVRAGRSTRPPAST